MKKSMLLIAMFGATLSMNAVAAEKSLSYTKLWTHAHATPGQVSEISAFDKRTNTLWVAGVVGVDVLDADTGELVEHIDVTQSGFVNSVAIHNGVVALAIEAFSSATAGDRRNPGKVLFYDTKTRQPSDGIAEVTVGSLPDMLTFTHDGSKLLVANEGTPNRIADAAYTAPDPAGSVSIIDMETRTVAATATLAGVPQYGSNLRTNVGMDFEPEYIAVDKDCRFAYVTLQEANGVAVLDLTLNAFTHIIGLGAKDFSVPGNEIDPLNGGTAPQPVFERVLAKGLYQPDAIAVYQWRGETYMVLANEGDFREDNADRATASSLGIPSTDVRRNLRVARPDSSAANLFVAGARSFSIRDAEGNLVYDSGSILDRQAAAASIYDDGRSRDKGVEPEGVALLAIGGRTYAFIGLERTTTASVAIFDISNPNAVEFVDLLVTPGDVSPEGLHAYRYRGEFFLAIANEVSNTTSLYLLEKVNPNAK